MPVSVGITTVTQYLMTKSMTTLKIVVMDVVIHYWVTVVMPTETGTGGLGLTII